MKKLLCITLFVFGDVYASQPEQRVGIKNLTGRALGGSMTLSGGGLETSRALKLPAQEEIAIEKGWLVKSLEISEKTIDGDWAGASLSHPSPENYGRIYDIVQSGDAIKIIKRLELVGDREFLLENNTGYTLSLLLTMQVANDEGIHREDISPRQEIRCELKDMLSPWHVKALCIYTYLDQELIAEFKSKGKNNYRRFKIEKGEGNFEIVASEK